MEERAVEQSINLNEKRRKAYVELSKSVTKTEGSINIGANSIIKPFMMLKSLNFMASIPSQFKSLIDSLDQLGKRADDIGMTASQLQELTHQCKLAGLSSSQLDGAIKAFNRNISLAALGTGEAKSALVEMGIELTNANGSTKTQSELLKETAYYFADNVGNAKNAGLAARVFGESGVDLLRVFGQGKNVIDGVFNAKGIDEAAAAAARFNDNLEVIKNVGFKVGGMIIEGWSQIFDFAQDIFGKGIGSTAAKRDLDKYNEQVRKHNLALIQAEEAKAKAIEEVNAQVEESDKKLFDSRMNNIDRVINYKNEINKLTKEIDEVLESEGKTQRYAELYKQRVDLTIALENAEKAVTREQEVQNAKLNAINERKRKAQEDAEKKAQAEAEKIKAKQDEQAKSYAEFLKEHELQKRIATAKYQGNEALVDRIKKEAEAQKLAEKYNISIAEANKLLDEQKKIKEINDGKNGRYSDKEIEKAKKILAKGKTGTIGSKTLEDAQNIIDGKATKYNLSIFDSANQKNKPKKRDFNRERNLNRGYATTPTPTKATNEKKDEQSKNISSMDESLKGIATLLADIKTLQQQAVVETSNLNKTLEADK